MARILSDGGKRLSEIVDRIPSYPYEEMDFPCPDKVKFSVMEEIVKGFRDQGLELDLTDGVKINFEDGWILMRPSNPSPKIRAAVEAHSEKRQKELIQLARLEFEKAKRRVM